MIQSLHPLDGITREPLYLQQVHGDVIHFRPRGQAGDGLVTDQAGDTLLLFTADCPILLYHFPGTAILAGVHAGWRGAARNITGKMVTHLQQRFNRPPPQLQVWLASGIDRCHYEVGRELVPLLQPFATPESLFEQVADRLLLDLKQLARNQLLLAGVPDEQITDISLDSYATPELHSCRGDGRLHGISGLFARLTDTA
ncbi:MAG: polyphenol oxidase family protein [Candidatus Delongbacteria bacterium]|nr:polyphenol oxidase family protein [Candidatus Delongbacteria bacterium]